MFTTFGMTLTTTALTNYKSNHAPAAAAHAGLAPHQLLLARAAQLAARGIVAADSHRELRAHCVSKLHQRLTAAQQQRRHAAWHLYWQYTLCAEHIHRHCGCIVCICALWQIKQFEQLLLMQQCTLLLQLLLCYAA
jgi:hypothetical protein